MGKDKLVTVRVDPVLYADAVVGKPRGWLSEAVRALLEEEVRARRQVGDLFGRHDLREDV